MWEIWELLSLKGDPSNKKCSEVSYMITQLTTTKVRMCQRETSVTTNNLRSQYITTTMDPNLLKMSLSLRVMHITQLSHSTRAKTKVTFYHHSMTLPLLMTREDLQL